MKAETVTGKSNVPVNKAEQNKEEIKHEEEARKQRKEEALNPGKKPSEVTSQNAHMYHMDAVKKLIGDNIQWREMRFYRREAEGQMYVDIVDKKTGDVLRTVPEPEFTKIATEFKHLAGMNLSING